MSQRIQSILFFITAALFALLFFFPLAEYCGCYNTIDFFVYGVDPHTPGKDQVPEAFQNMFALPVLVLTVTSILLSLFLSIGLKKAVKLAHFQRIYRFAKINDIVIIVWIMLVYAFYLRYIGKPLDVGPSFIIKDRAIGAFFPLVALFLSLWATISLKKDIKRVRSVDRIR